jgi:hypothetical protein
LKEEEAFCFDHIALIIPTASSSCAILTTVAGKSYPYCLYSSSCHPAPIPNSIRPLLIISRVDNIFASNAGLRYELQVTTCPSFTLLVITAIDDNNVKLSNKSVLLFGA